MRTLLAGSTTALGVGLAALALIATPTPANACGGFFCSQVPIDQMGEQIIFGVEGGHITAQILINYTGDAKDFAWVLPVASKPEITLGSNAAFQAIAGRTQPFWNLQWDYEDNQCGGYRFLAPSAMEDSDGGQNTAGGVTVLEEKEVGPFEIATLESSDAEQLVDWLNERGFDQPPEATPLIDHYLKSGMLFVAIKLGSSEPTGAIQPIVLEFEEADPCVPLVLTQIAAVPDMPVQLYLLGEHRIAPNNWMHVVLNEKKIDWLNFGQNYGDVVSQAVDEAAGHGFVTEYAGTSDILDRALYTEGRFDLAKLAAISDPARFVSELLSQGFPRDATMQSLLRKHIPMPQSLIDQGVDERSFYNDLDGYSHALQDIDFDGAAFAADLEERVIAPLRSTQLLFDRNPYLTRLYTTVSPDEMTRDPIFAENPDLGDVSNQHTAQAVAECNPDNPEVVDRITITLESGEVFTIDGPFDGTWWPGNGPFVDGAPEESAAKRIELIGRTGAPQVVDPSQVDAVDQALDSQEPSDVMQGLVGNTFPITPTTPSNPSIPLDATGSGSCQGGGTPTPVIFAMFALLLLVRRQRAIR